MWTDARPPEVQHSNGILEAGVEKANGDSSFRFVDMGFLFKGSGKVASLSLLAPQQGSEG